MGCMLLLCIILALLPRLHAEYCVLQISKGPQHSAVVYTPCTVEDDGLHVLNLTLPEGMISSDVLPDPGTNMCALYIC